MKRSACILLLLCLCAGLGTAAHADATVDGLLAAVVRKSATDTHRAPFVAVECGGTRYVCRIKDGRCVKKTASTPRTSLAGDWASVFVLPVDATFRGTAQGAGWLLHRSGGTWSLVALNEGVGYPKQALARAKVPADIIRTLKLETIQP